MALKGLKNLHYAIITSEDDEKTEYGLVKKFGPAVAFNMQPSINTSNHRADDKVMFSDSAKGPIAVTVNTSYLEKEVEADVLGKTIHPNGLMSDNVNDQAPYIAIGGECEDARGGSSFFWVYRVKLQPYEENRETKQETPTYQTPNLSGQALPRLHDGEEKIKVWTGDDTIDKSIFESWFDEVVDRETLPMP